MRRFQVLLAKHPRLFALASCLVLLGLSYTWVRGQGELPADSPRPGPTRDEQPAPDRASGRAGSAAGGGDYSGEASGRAPRLRGGGGRRATGGATGGMGMPGMGGPVETQASSFRAELIVLKADWSKGDDPSRRERVEAELKKLLAGFSLPSQQLAAIARQPTRFLFPDELAAFYRAEDWEATLAWMREQQLVLSEQKGEVDVEDQASRRSRTPKTRVELSLELERSRWPAGIQTPSDPVRIKQLTSRYLLMDRTFASPHPGMGDMMGGMMGGMDMDGMDGGMMMPGGMAMGGGMPGGIAYESMMGEGGTWMPGPVNPTDRSHDAIHVQIESQLVEEELLHFPVTSTLDSRTLLHFGTALWVPAGYAVVMPWYGPRDTSLREKSLREGADALLVIHARRAAADMGMGMEHMGGLPPRMGGLPAGTPETSAASQLRRPQRLVPLKLVIAERSNVWDYDRADAMPGMMSGMMPGPGMMPGMGPMGPGASADTTAPPRAEDESGDEAARSPAPRLDGPVDSADGGYFLPPDSAPAKAAEFRPATDPVEDQATLAQARQRYHRSERLAAQQAARVRAIPDDDPRQAEALETLRQAVREAFARRLGLQRIEAAALRQRLGRLEANLDQRETLSDEITARRVEQLLEDPATRWDADPAEVNR